MKPKIKLTFNMYKGVNGYFYGRPFFGKALQLTPEFPTKQEAAKYKKKHDLDDLWDEILKFPKTYEPFSFKDTQEETSSEEIKETLGMKEVTVGNGYNNVSFSFTAKQALDGFCSLANFLHLPSKAIGLNGTISLRVGITQGKVSGISAFLKNDNFIRVTTTKDKGATIARSWFDAVNFYLGTLVGKEDFLPNLMMEDHDVKNFKKVLGDSLYESYQSLLEHIYLSTQCDIVERTKKCYPKGYSVYATPENILTRCLEEYVKTNAPEEDVILSSRLDEYQFKDSDPILTFEFRQEFNRYPYPINSERNDVLQLAGDLVNNMTNFLS